MANWPVLGVDEAWQPYQAGDGRTWNRARAAHLLRRAGFGFTPRQLAIAVEDGPQATVRKLVGAVPDDAYQTTIQSLADSVLAGGEPRDLAAWWLYRMLHTPAPLRERLTLIWHGHFATSGAKVADARLLMSQHDLFQRHAIGSFRSMAHGIARDPAMLLYLDSATNRRSHPNENFARELLELFCLGLGNYTERDIQQLARCFTGWEVRNGSFRFNRFQHDRGEKEFLGRRGGFTGEEAIDVVLDQPSVANFLVRKLVQELVADEPVLSEEYCRPLSERFRASGLDLADLVATILGSRLMLEDPPVGRKVRSPIDFAIGWLRSLDGATNLQQLSQDLGQLGQALFFPPNVKGWPGGRAWVNSGTMAGRANLVRRLVQDGGARFGGGTLDEWVGRQGWSGPEATVDGLSELWFAAPLGAATRKELIALLQAPQAGVRGVAHAMSLLPEMHIA